MPAPRKPPHVVSRPGRDGLFAYLSREERFVPLNTSDPEEAAIRLGELLDARRLREVDPGDKPIASLFGEHFRRSKTNHSKKTNYEQGRNGRRILAWLESRGIASIRQVTRDVVEDYKTARRFARDRKRLDAKGELVKGVSAFRINAEINTWIQVTRIGIEWGLVADGALKAFVKLKEPRAQPHRIGLTKAEIERFVAAEEHPGYRAFFRVVIGSGIRDDEARHMSESDIQPPWLIVTPKPPGACECHPDGWNTKGYRYRSIPISAATAKAARSYVAVKGDISLEAKTVWNRVQAAAKSAKVAKHVSLHDFRRAWASHMLAAGNSLQDISRWLGHADIMTTMRYLRIVTEDVPDPKRLPF
jgi:integrase